MIARGAIHNPKIFEEFKNSYDQLDLDEERELVQKEFNEDDLDNDVLELKDENALKLNKSGNEFNKEDELGEKEKENEESNNAADEKNKKEANKKNKNKNKNGDDDTDDVKTSQNLARIFYLKYQGRDFDLDSIIKDFIIFVSLCFLIYL